MRRTSVWRCCCAILLTGLGMMPAAQADDWLSGAANPKPPQFRAARYQETPTQETPAEQVLEGSPHRMGSDPEVVPAPQPLHATDPYAVGPHGEYEDFIGLDGFVDECASLFGSGPGQIIAGAEYLNVRPTFSEATAYAQIDNFTTNSVQHLVQYDFGYESSPRVYIGYRRPDCDTELRFTYTQFTGASEIASGPTSGDQVFILDPFLPICDCLEVNARATVNANMYDIDMAKRQCLAPKCCGTSPCGPACVHPCQPWDITYWFGLRIADVSWNATGDVVETSSGDIVSTNIHDMNFVGAGPRVGINVRRYFGRTNRLSLYARANIALILGQYEISSTYIDPLDDDTDSNNLSRDRIIPVTEIEVGFSYSLRKRTTISAGYFMQAWHDLGMSQQITGQYPQGYDDANILSFDGMFIRGEWAF